MKRQRFKYHIGKDGKIALTVIMSSTRELARTKRRSQRNKSRKGFKRCLYIHEYNAVQTALKELLYGKESSGAGVWAEVHANDQQPGTDLLSGDE